MDPKFWELVPLMTNHIPDAQEIAEMEAIEDYQRECQHLDINDEDGCPDCGFYSK